MVQLLSTLALATVATGLVAPSVSPARSALRSISDTESEIIAVEPVAADAPEPVVVTPVAPPRGWDAALDMPAGIARRPRGQLSIGLQ